MSTKPPRNVLQDQLVVLSIDIEDKSRLCELLKKNIAKETNALHGVESSITEHFETLIQVSTCFICCILSLTHILQNELNESKLSNENVLQKSNLVGFKLSHMPTKFKLFVFSL
jgi:hypothetical protein